MRKINILMTGAGAPGAPGIIQCYKKNGEREVTILGTDIKEKVPMMCELDGFVKTLKASDPGFIDNILDVAKKHKIDVIQPLVTRELELFANAKKDFEKYGIKICVSPLENLVIANDKGKLLERLLKLGIRIPEFRKINHWEDFEKASIELGYPERAICFKPTQANGSRGFRVIDAKKNTAELMFREKPNSVYIDYDYACRVLKDIEVFPELLVMEYMPGEEYSVDMLLKNGKVIYCVPRLRLQMNGGISTCCRVVKELAVIDYCTQIAESLELHGNIGIQVRKAEDGAFKILEINPRVQGSIVACAAAGVNLPYHGIKLALDEEIPEVEILWNTEMERCWREVYFDDAGYAFTY